VLTTLLTISDYLYGSSFITHTIVAVFFIPVCWWIGFQYDKIQFSSDKDFLTEVHNRRFVYKSFPKLCALSDRNQKCLGLMVLDINDFKAINDKFGHNKGDFVLQQISALLLQLTRRSDVVARWGGDEFIIMAPLIDTAGLEALTNRIKMDLIKLSDSHHSDISVSIGTAVYPTDAVTLEELIDIADSNMYKIKKQKETSRST
jgi:diguanylate cyclase (GGDEF)-like protein